VHNSKYDCYIFPNTQLPYFADIYREVTQETYQKKIYYTSLLSLDIVCNKLICNKERLCGKYDIPCISDENIQIFYSIGNNMLDRKGRYPSIVRNKKTFTITVIIFTRMQKTCTP